MKVRFASTMTALLLGVAVMFCFCSAASAVPTVPGGVAAAPATQEEIPEDIKQAFEDFKQMKFDDAVTKLEQARKANPDLAPAQLLLAQWFSMLNPPQPQAVRQAIEVAVTKNPGDPEAYVILAELNLQSGNVTEAEVLYTHSSNLLKSFNESAKRKGEIQKRILLGLSQVYAARGRTADALTQLNAVLQIDPPNLGALDLAGRIYFNDGKIAEAIAAFDKIRAQNEEVLLSEARVALMFQSKGTPKDASKAGEYMQLAIKKAPKDAQVRMAAAQWSIQIGNIKQAASQADAALQLKPDSLDAQMLRGVIALYERNFTLAEQSFQKILAESPSNFAASNNLALALCEQGDEAKLKKAEEYAVVNVRQFQNQPEAFSTAAWVLYQKGQYNEAIQLLEKSIQLSNGQMSQDTAYYLAATLNKIGGEDNVKRAKEIVSKMLEGTTGLFPMRSEAEKLNNELK